MTEPAYCTILARNYLPAALALSESLREHGDGTPLTVFLIDATADTALPEVPGVRWMHPWMLDLDERTILELAMSYDLVEFATALKPLVLLTLLEEHERVAYLDPDTYVVTPMDEPRPPSTRARGSSSPPTTSSRSRTGASSPKATSSTSAPSTSAFAPSTAAPTTSYAGGGGTCATSACTIRSRACSWTRSGSISAACSSAPRASGTTGTTPAS